MKRKQARKKENYEMKSTLKLNFKFMSLDIFTFFDSFVKRRSHSYFLFFRKKRNSFSTSNFAFSFNQFFSFILELRKFTSSFLVVIELISSHLNYIRAILVFLQIQYG
jgi:hypothetical protein